MASDDFCVVCADAMDWTGYGPCNHKEACSRCVARLRFVLDDKKCVICREESPEVFFTRFSGDYTARLGPEQFKQLKERAKRGDLQHLPEVDGYFDDPDHYAYIKQLCSYTHPVLSRTPEDSPAFNSLSALKRKVAEVSKLNFCDLCLTGRKVFISEQVLYTKPDLERHMRTGDDAGPLAESGFSGHPNCRFCRRRFYDSGELYKHMESRHEHCFLCRRQRPDKYVYYRDYNELDEHFRDDHHMCPHPSCLEKKFVVFAQEVELKRHIATEHGDEMNMSRAQRRQALTIPIDLQYTRGSDLGRNADLPPSRPGVVIGGGGAGSIGPPPGARGRGGRGAGMRHSRSDTGLAAAVAASIDSSQAEAAQRAAAAAAAAGEERLASVTFSAEDFPSVSGGGRGGVTAPLGTWVGAPGASGSSASAQHFPALPSLSRSQKKRAKEQSTAQTLAARMGVGARTGPPRVLNVAVPGRTPAMPAPGTSSSAAGPSTASSSGVGAEHGSAAGPSSGVRHVHSTPSLGGPADDDSDGFDEDFERQLLLQQRQQPAESSSIVDDFPLLPSGPVAAAHPSWMPVKSRAPKPRARSAAGGTSTGTSTAPSAASAVSAGPGMAASRADDFPSLAAAMPAAAAAATTRKPRGRPSSANTGGIRVVNAAQPAPAPVPPQPSAAEAVAAAGGVSDSLKAANRALIDKIKRQLDEAGFASFRAQSAGFMHGDVDAATYHRDIVGLGLLPLVPELAALCPEPQRRSALMAAHRAFLGSDRAHDMRALGSSWVPPEAGLAAADRAEALSSWTCVRCTLLNAPQAGSCEVCGAAKPKPGAAVEAQAGTAAATTSSPGPKSKGKASTATSSAWGAGASGNSSTTGATSSSNRAAPAAAAASAGPSVPGSDAGIRANGAFRSQSPAVAAVSSNHFPALAGTSSSTASAATNSSGAQQQQQPPQPGKKKKPEKQSLQALLASGAVHPGNAWTQNRSSAGPSATAGLGQWGKGGGKKLAKQAKDLGFAAP